MDKPNVFKSSSFHLDEGDILHLLFRDETGVTMDVDLWSADTTTETIPDAPTALDASDITITSFNANWHFNENSTGYYLDVATDSAFTHLVAGYNNLNVGNVNTYTVAGLHGLVTYYYRLRAYNNAGTGANSNIENAITLVETVIDVDGNVYTYVTIGTQQWLVENLKVTHYSDGTAIPNVSLEADWIAEDGTVGHDGGYCWYDNDIANKPDYGALYNWYAVDNAHGVGITGWRVPTKADADVLLAYIGGELVGGGKLKEVGLTHWFTPNTGATDEFGFKALGAGIREDAGGAGWLFLDLTGYAYFYTSDDLALPYSFGAVYQIDDFVYFTFDKRHGLSIRCMRDI